MGDDDQMLIFTNTKRMVELLEDGLGKFGMSATGMHGDKAQNRRGKFSIRSKKGKPKLLSLLM